jgi:hypothetical protein
MNHIAPPALSSIPLVVLSLQTVHYLPLVTQIIAIMRIRVSRDSHDNRDSRELSRGYHRLGGYPILVRTCPWACSQ